MKYSVHLNLILQKLLNELNWSEKNCYHRGENTIVLTKFVTRSSIVWPSPMALIHILTALIYSCKLSPITQHGNTILSGSPYWVTAGTSSEFVSTYFLVLTETNKETLCENSWALFTHLYSSWYKKKVSQLSWKQNNMATFTHGHFEWFIWGFWLSESK